MERERDQAKRERTQTSPPVQVVAATGEVGEMAARADPARAERRTTAVEECIFALTVLSVFTTGSLLVFVP